MKVYINIIVFTGILFFNGCTRKSTEDSSGQYKEKATEKELHIGISKIVSHPALDAIEQAIIKTVQDSKPEVRFNLQNANGESSAAHSIAQLFQNEKIDIAVGIATPTSQTLVQNLSGIPIFYSGVTDPEGAGLLSKINSGMQITGYSDLTPVRNHITAIKRIQSESVQVIGQIFSSDEDNARVLNEITSKSADENGLRLLSVAVTNTAEVRDAALSIINRIDAFYITADNKVISALAALSEVADQYNIPIYSADPSSARSSDVKIAVAMGFDYSSMGKVTGELITRYLNGEDSVFEKSLRYLPLEHQLFVINWEQVNKLGLTIPEDIQKLDSDKNHDNG